MGSWSESCGFSGIEIGCGEVAYVMLMDNCKGDLNDGAFIHYSPTTTLLRGTYDDYGYLKVDEDEAVLAVFNKQSGLSLKNGDDFSLDDLDGRTERRWWMHGGMFDFMPTIKQDFPYYGMRRGGYKSVKVKNIGHAADMHVNEVRQTYEELRASIADRMKTFKDSDDPEQVMAMALLLSDRGLTDIFGYGRRRAGGYREMIQEAAKANLDNIEGILEAHRRTFLVGYALSELRRTLAPNESCGPQHGGEQASCQFARAILATQKQRKKRWD